MKFSRHKFTSLPPLRQLRKIFQLCRLVEADWLRHGAPPANELAELRRLCEWTTATLPEGFHVPADADTPLAFIAAVSPLYDSFGYAPDDSALDIPVDFAGIERQIIPLKVVLVNLRSAFNVGSIIRTAECVGAERVVTCGCTPPAAHPRVAHTARGTQEVIECLHISDPVNALEQVKTAGVPLVALETGWEDSDIHHSRIPRPCAIVLGNEAHGLDDECLALCDRRVQIPVMGMKNSLNVGVAFGICAYEIYRKWTYEISTQGTGVLIC
ncbi:MAG: hypothetical protein K8R90_04950 [Candidatus Cloacimonetes bacterium]|nr:hypothetical protein [Candidatus Cloacimonadota bacterium]